MTDPSQALIDDVLDASGPRSPSRSASSGGERRVGAASSTASARSSADAARSSAADPSTERQPVTAASDGERSATAHLPDHLRDTSTAAVLALLDQRSAVEWLPTQLLLRRL